MKIEKVLNNNMVSAYNAEGKEVILKGKSLGFGKKKGDEVDRKLVERVFIQNDKRDARIILPICDHIAGAVERYRNGTILRNAMIWDGKRFYPNEFKVGQYALDLIRKRSGRL